MTNKFTPGPWEVCEEKAGLSTTFRSIREATPFNRFGGKHTIVGATGYHSSRNGEVYGPSIGKEDAQLISAAPDLYEACKLCLQVLSGETMTKQTLVDAMAAATVALKKAEGNQP